MPISSDSAKIKFFVGDFDYTTSLAIPSTSQSNTLTLNFEELISDQLINWDTPPLELYAMLKVDFEGEEIYINEEYNTTLNDYPPESPDITITPDANPATEETAATNYYVPMILNSDGTVANGKYSVSVRIVFNTSAGWDTTDETTFTANLNHERKQPVINEWYDQNLPILTVEDTQDYSIGTTIASLDTEFVLYPPQNKAAITNTYTDVQNASYSSFWTGGNEVQYTALIEYESSYIVVQVEQKYESFDVYWMDWCSTYTCLNELYTLATGANCGTKQKTIYQDRWLQATSLIQQIQLGLGCGKSTISELIVELNNVLDCSCGCLDETPRHINAPNVVPISDIQFATAIDSITEIDLSKGSTVYLSVDIIDGSPTDETEVHVTNFSENGKYRFIMISTSQSAVQDVTFDPTVFDSPIGNVVAYLDSKIIIYDFIATSQTELTLESTNISTSITSISEGAGIEINTTNPFVPQVRLTSQSIANLALASTSLQEGDGYVNYVPQYVEATTTTTVIDLSEGNVISLNLVSSSTEVSVTNIEENKRYIFEVYSSARHVASFDSSFVDTDGSIKSVLPSGVSNTRTTLEFIGSDLDSEELLLLSRTDTEPSLKNLITTSSLTTLDVNLYDTFDISVNQNTEIDFSGDVVLNKKYTLILDSSSDYDIEFDSSWFLDSQGEMESITLSGDSDAKTVLEFIGVDDGSNVVFALISNNIPLGGDENPSYQDLGVESGSVEIDLSLGKNVHLAISNNPATIDCSNLEVGESYSIQIDNNGSTSEYITFDSGTIIIYDVSNKIRVDSGQSLGLNFVCVDIGGDPILRTTGEAKPSLSNYKSLNSGDLGAIPLIDFNFATNNQLATYIIDTENLVISSSSESSIVDGRPYLFLVKNTSGSTKTLTMDSDVFIGADLSSNIVKSIDDGETVSLSFIGVNSGFLATEKCVLTSEIG